MADWLEDEANAAGRLVRNAHLDRIKAMGVPGESISKIGTVQMPFGVAKIAELEDGLYQPDPDGIPAVIVPVVSPEFHDGLFCEEIVLFPVIDIIAFQTNRPASWRWRVGHAWALGEHLLHDADQHPVELVATPLAWLASGGEAACILDWSAESPAWAVLRSGPQLIVNDHLLEKRLRKAIAAAAPRPSIRRDRNAAQPC